MADGDRLLFLKFGFTVGLFSSSLVSAPGFRNVFEVKLEDLVVVVVVVELVELAELPVGFYGVHVIF